MSITGYRTRAQYHEQESYSISHTWGVGGYYSLSKNLNFIAKHILNF